MREKKRGKRPLLGGFRDPLSFHKEFGYHYHVFNDDPLKPGEIEAAKAAGYEVVIKNDPLGDKTVDTPEKVGKAVTRPVGAGVTGVLMRKPIDEYNEDQLEKQKLVDETEAAIKRHSRQKGRYGEIKIGSMTEDG